MTRKGFLKIGSAGLLLSGSILSSAATASEGVARNQAALNVAGLAAPDARVCTQPVGSPLLVRNQCALGDGASHLTGAGGSSGGVIIGIAALIAVGAGIYV